MRRLRRGTRKSRAEGPLEELRGQNEWENALQHKYKEWTELKESLESRKRKRSAEEVLRKQRIEQAKRALSLQRVREDEKATGFRKPKVRRPARRAQEEADEDGEYAAEEDYGDAMVAGEGAAFQGVAQDHVDMDAAYTPAGADGAYPAADGDAAYGGNDTDAPYVPSYGGEGDTAGSAQSGGGGGGGGGGGAVAGTPRQFVPSTVFVGNLNEHVTKAFLAEKFGEFGMIDEVRTTGKNFAFLKFNTSAAAHTAVSAMDGMVLVVPVKQMVDGVEVTVGEVSTQPLEVKMDVREQARVVVAAQASAGHIPKPAETEEDPRAAGRQLVSYDDL